MKIIRWGYFIFVMISLSISDYEGVALFGMLLVWNELYMINNKLEEENSERIN